jgi:hypothetical protein
MQMQQRHAGMTAAQVWDKYGTPKMPLLCCMDPSQANIISKCSARFWPCAAERSGPLHHNCQAWLMWFVSHHCLLDMIWVVTKVDGISKPAEVCVQLVLGSTLVCTAPAPHAPHTSHVVVSILVALVIHAVTITNTIASYSLR